jgi:hypothetical protein
MWVLVYWILMADGRGNAATTGQVEFTTSSACERARAALSHQPAISGSVCFERD